MDDFAARVDFQHSWTSPNPLPESTHRQKYNTVLVDGFKDSQHKRLLSFTQKWPNSDSAEEAKLKREEIAAAMAKEILGIARESSRRSKIKRFERDFKDLMQSPAIKAAFKQQ